MAWLLTEVTLLAEKPMTAEYVSIPVNLSKLNKQSSIDLAVLSMSTILPFLSPVEGTLEIPRILIVPS